MPIVPSRSRETQALVARLSSPRPAEREAAVARLILLGPRALPAVLAALPGSGPELRLCVLHLLEHTGDPRARAEVMALCRDRDVAVARRALALLSRYAEPKAVATAARILAGGPADLRIPAARALCALHGRGLVEALEPLVDVILDETEDEAFCREALASLHAVDPETAATLRERRARGPGSLVRTALWPSLEEEDEPSRIAALLRRLEHPARRGDEALRIARDLQALDASALPALHTAFPRATDPRILGALADTLGRLRSPTSIPVLSHALKRLRDLPLRARDEAQADAISRLHLALAALDSRIALFDLRESLAAVPLLAAAVLLEAAERIGDASLLPALARIHAEEEALRARSASVFAAIVARERLRPRSAALRGLKPEDREALRTLWATLPAGYSRTLPVMGTKRTGRTRRSS